MMIVFLLTIFKCISICPKYWYHGNFPTFSLVLYRLIIYLLLFIYSFIYLFISLFIFIYLFIYLKFTECLLNSSPTLVSPH